MIDTQNYQEMRRVVYAGSPGIGNAVFLPICDQCGRFIKADESVSVSEMDGLKDVPNATCSKHGRIKMVFEGYE